MFEFKRVISIVNDSGKLYAEEIFPDEINWKRKGYLFSIEVELFGNGIRITDVDAETIPFDKVFYLTMENNDYSEIFCTSDYDMHLDHNIEFDGWGYEVVNGNYQETIVLSMDLLKAERLDEVDAFNYVIKERAVTRKEDAIFESGNYYR